MCSTYQYKLGYRPLSLLFRNLVTLGLIFQGHSRWKHANITVKSFQFLFWKRQSVAILDFLLSIFVLPLIQGSHQLYKTSSSTFHHFPISYNFDLKKYVTLMRDNGIMSVNQWSHSTCIHHKVTKSPSSWCTKYNMWHVNPIHWIV